MFSLLARGPYVLIAALKVVVAAERALDGPEDLAIGTTA
jgi:hypothetical protein